MVLFFGFLFLMISGCKPRSTENSDDSTISDTATANDDRMLAPEYGAQDEDWMEMPVEEEVIEEEKFDTKGNYTKNQATEKQVPQHAPGPMEPATAYGTNYQQYNTTVDPVKPQE